MANAPDPTEMTVDELEQNVESNDYTGAQLRTMRDAEQDSDESRSTALEAIDEELNDATSGPDQPGETSEPSGGDGGLERDESQLIEDGGGATEQGTVGLVLPDPYADGAPDRVEINVNVPMGFAGTMYEDKGTHTCEYSMRVKRALESSTNTVTIDVRDPLHPNHDEG